MAIVRTRQGLLTYLLPMLSMAVDIYDCHPTKLTIQIYCHPAFPSSPAQMGMLQQ